jgi:hypothetical protein
MLTVQQVTLSLFRKKLSDLASDYRLKSIAVDFQRLRFHYVSFIDQTGMVLYLYIDRRDLKIWEANLCEVVHVASEMFINSVIRITSGLDEDSATVEYEIPVKQFKQSREYKNWLKKSKQMEKEKKGGGEG